MSRLFFEGYILLTHSQKNSEIFQFLIIFLGPHLDSNFSLVTFKKTSFKTLLTGSNNFSAFNASSF
jgi:hypothetical protein